MMQSGTPLHGVSEQDVGIMDCYSLVKELKKLKADGIKASDSSVADEAKGGNDGAGEKEKDKKDEDMDSATLMLVDESMVEDDPIKKAVQKAAEAKMDGVTFWRKLADVEPALNAAVYPSWHLIFMVDCYTSRPKVCLEYLGKIKAWAEAAKVKSFKVAVPVGKRFDLLDKVMQGMSTLWPKTMQCYISTLSAGDTQSVRHRCNYVVIGVFGEANGFQAPVSAPLLKCRAKKSEKLRMRCMNRSCPLRSPDEVARIAAATESVDPSREIEPDDLEVEDDGGYEEDEETGGSGSLENFQEGQRDYLIDLWCFSRPESFYGGLYSFMDVAQAQMIVIISTSGHPSSVVAARKTGLPIHVVIDRISEHSYQHGQILAMERFKDRAI